MKKISKDLLNKAATGLGENAYETQTYLQALTPQQQVLTNKFFNTLAGILGSQFNDAFPTDQSENDSKLSFGPLIASFSEDDLRRGFTEVAKQAGLGGLEYFKLGTVLPFFDKWLPNRVKINELWAEYNNRGIAATETQYDRDGREYNKEVFRGYSSGVIFETVKRIGKTAEFLMQEQGRYAQAAFEDKLMAVLVEAKNRELTGQEPFKLPVALEDKSSEVKPREHYKEAGKAGHKDFMKQFKGLK